MQLLTKEKLPRKPRVKSKYNKVSNEARQKLVEMVYLQDYLLKDAAKILKINYSTAKTILRIFRKEKRLNKKNADDELEIKTLINNFREDDFIKTCLNVDAENSDSKETTDSNQVVVQPVDGICGSIQKLTSLVNKCFESIKLNQQMINNLMIMSVRLNEKFSRGNNPQPLNFSLEDLLRSTLLEEYTRQYV
jgi:hypothetical protein